MQRFLFVTAVWLIVGPVLAATPSIEAVAPGIGQRGTEFDVKLVGAGFGDAEELLLYHPGVTCLSLRATSDNELTLRLRAEDQCRLGSHPFRIRTRRGITELRTFRLTPLPIIASVEPNDGPEAPQSIERNVTVQGVIESDDADCYRMTLKAGERLAAEIEAVRLGGSLLDLKLTVLGPDGKVLAAVDDTSLFRQDPCLTLVAPRDGDYVVKVSENTLEGDNNSRYALHLGTFPRPLAVYPVGGPVGETLEVRALGDAIGEFSQNVNLPRMSEGDYEFFPRHGDSTAPTPHRFRISNCPNVLEDEANQHAAILPAAFNGIIQEPGDSDRFAFQASAGDRWQFELFASRVGSPLDGVLEIQNAAGELLVRSDDDESHDGLFEFEVPELGTYHLQIIDKRGSGGPLFVYRVEATVAKPRLTAFLPRPDRRSQDQQTVCVPQGNRVLAYLGVQRDGVTCDVLISAGDLPSGMTMNGGRLPSDRYWTPVVFEASAGAPLAGALVPLTASGQVGGRTVQGGFRQVVDLVAGPADALYHSSEVDRLAVAVTESAPFRIELQPPTAALARDGTLALQVQVERQPGFDGAVDVTFPFLPPWVDGPAKLSIPSDQKTGVYVLQAWQQAEPRTWVLCAEGKPGLDVDPGAAMQPTGEPPQRRRSRKSASAIRDVRVCSQLIELTIASPAIRATPVTVAGEQSQTARLRLRLEPTAQLPEKLTATLEGLPNRVKAPAVTLDNASREVEFAIQLDPTAPLGEFTGLVCRLSGEWDGQAVSYCVGRGSVLTVEPPGGLVTDVNGRPLTKLEALRRARQTSKAKSPATESQPDSAANSTPSGP